LKAEGKTVADHPAYSIADKMVETYKRPGKAAGGGFYEYPKEGKKFLWPGLAEAFPHKVYLDQKTMIERMIFIQCIETVRCMEEGVLTSVADGNIGSIFGWGFAPFKGGMADSISMTMVSKNS
jgi:3-hydroxyacyl-CoA dehydrogenase/enoyl-CoA hydratase/3-hydroxybutyryl-CoA epimerase